MRHNEYHNVTADIEVDCVTEGAEQLNRQKREVVQEEPLTVEIKGVGTYTMMCTPCDEMALAVGFAFSEGLIRNKNDIHLLAVCPDNRQIIRMRLADGGKEKKEQHGVLIVSSCGICGSEAIEKIVQSLPTAGDSLRITKEELTRMPEA
ncbi:MAG: formate dehydrogenase accessory sulfurtransferase FdhD, partial [Sedimentisphaerales bacterium]|nr:formate dehydrogenase accessory sulfurtransferase FdhD [Sedimentisphaerales bacterium]